MKPQLTQPMKPQQREPRRRGERATTCGRRQWFVALAVLALLTLWLALWLVNVEGSDVVALRQRHDALRREHQLLQQRYTRMHEDCFAERAVSNATAASETQSVNADNEAAVLSREALLDSVPQSGLYTCRKDGLFAGAWFTSTAYFNTLPFRVPSNVEGACWTPLMYGVCKRSVDFLDFFVEHLSVYEQVIYVQAVQDVATQAQFVTALAMNLERHVRELTVAIDEAQFARDVTQRVVAVVPFFGGKIGAASHSLHDTRLAYLEATMRSVQATFAHVVVGVTGEEDERLVRSRGYVLFDVLRMPPELASDGPSLAVSTLMSAQNALRSDERWLQRNFSHIYYTEADQVLRVRSLERLVQQVTGKRVLVPHRIMAVPTPRDFPRDLLRRMSKEYLLDKYLGSVSEKPVKRLDANLETMGSCCLKGLNQHHQVNGTFWYFDTGNGVGMSPYDYFWSQLGSLALIPGEQGHDHVGWKCDITTERKLCTEPAAPDDAFDYPHVAPFD